MNDPHIDPNDRLAAIDPALCAARLPKAFHTLIPHLCADQEGVKFGTSQASDDDTSSGCHGCVTISVIIVYPDTMTSKIGVNAM